MLLKQGKQDLLTYYVFDTRENAGQKAGNDIADAILSMLEKKEELNMIFAAAPSQNETLQALLGRKEIPWERINAFHMDEYIGLSKEAPQRFGNFLREAIFGRVNFKSVNYIDGGAEDIEAECARYTKLLKEYPVDIVCLGIGENGHIAFNDPGVADFADQALIKVASLDEVCRKQQVNDGCFAVLDEVPRYALTLTIPALVGAGKMFCTVPAATKKWAVKQTIQGEISEDCPATIMRRHGNAILYCDSQSGADLL